MREQSVGGRRAGVGRHEGQARKRGHGVPGAEDVPGRGSVSDTGGHRRSEQREGPNGGRHVGGFVPAGQRRDGQPAAFGRRAGHPGEAGVSDARGEQVGAVGKPRTVSHGGGADQSRGRDQTVARGEDYKAAQIGIYRSRRGTACTE